MPDTASTLWAVIVGGAIGIVGGFCGPVFLHWRQRKEREQKRRKEKFEELLAFVFEFENWIDVSTALRMNQKMDQRPLSPIGKMHATAAMYYPQFLARISRISRLANSYESWLAQAVLEFATVGERPTEGAEEYVKELKNEMNLLLQDLTDYATKEFGKRE